MSLPHRPTEDLRCVFLSLFYINSLLLKYKENNTLFTIINGYNLKLYIRECSRYRTHRCAGGHFTVLIDQRLSYMYTRRALHAPFVFAPRRLPIDIVSPSDFYFTNTAVAAGDLRCLKRR